MEEQKKLKKKFIRNIIITLIALAFVALIFYKAPDFILSKSTDAITLIINNKNLTNSQRLKNEVIVENGIVYLSKEDVSNFFDKYLYYDNKYEKYITTAGDKLAAINVNDSIIEINGITSRIKGKILERNGKVYFPISEMTEVYDIDVININEKNTVIIDSTDREQIQVEAIKDINVKYKMKILSSTLEKAKKGSKLILISQNDNGWAKVRTENGIIGYVKQKDIANQTIIREKKTQESLISDNKISMVWDFYSEYVNVPNRLGTTIDGINVISPSFFTLEKSGKGSIIDKATNGGIQYVNWAKQKGYKVWAMINNNSLTETTSEILNDYEKRKVLIENILEMAEKYSLDGINVDFENISVKDKEMYSRLIIEMYPRLKEKGLALSVDVTAPDGGENWSLCYDRKTISENSDYIIFMGYDQTSGGSKKPGTTAGYNWVKNNIDKFLGQEGVEKNKIILAIPFYTRIWTEDSDGTYTSKVVNMKDIDSAIPTSAERNWNDTLRQYYVEYTDNGQNKKIWIEDLKSVKEKLLLANEYDLPGVAFWELDRQDDNVWSEVNKIILNK